MIKALSWQLRPYYLHHQWQIIRKRLLMLLREATRQKCSNEITQLLSDLKKKQKQNATTYWLPMDYNLGDPTWQQNIARVARAVFPEEEFNLDLQDCTSWRKLKNRVERVEQEKASEFILDDFESDTRAAEIEEERWKKNKAPYSALIEGIDYLEPVAGIDY